MSIVTSVAGAFLDRYRVYFYAAAAIAIAATVASATVYVMHLQSKSAAFDALTAEVDQLKSVMACADAEGVLACVTSAR